MCHENGAHGAMFLFSHLLHFQLQSGSQQIEYRPGLDSVALKFQYSGVYTAQKVLVFLLRSTRERERFSVVRGEREKKAGRGSNLLSDWSLRIRLLPRSVVFFYSVLS